MSANAIRNSGRVVRYVKEATAGTDPGGSFTITLAAAPTAKLQKKQEYRASQALYQGQGGLAPARHIKGRENIPWNASHYLRFKGQGLLWSLIVGAPASPVNNGDGTYTHKWDLDKDPATATLSVVEGDALGSLTTQEHEGHGCVVSSATVTIDAHDFARLAMSGFAMTADAPASAGAITLTDDSYNEIHGHMAGTISWNGASYNFISLELTIPINPIFRDVQGQAGTARPYAVNQKEIRAVVTMDKVGDVFTGGNTTETTSDLVLTYTDTAPNPDHTFTITLHNAIVVDSDGGNADGFGLIRERVTFAPQPDGTDSGLRITIVNDQSTSESA